MNCVVWLRNHSTVYKAQTNCKASLNFVRVYVRDKVFATSASPLENYFDEHNQKE